MKARLISQETVYLYHIGLNSQRGQEITQALGEISVQVKEIKEEQLGETLGYCLKTILRWRKKALTRRSLS